MLGGVRRARMEILRHVLERVNGPRALALEVGIGNGENLAFLPAGWTVHGVDIARTQLEDCIRRHPAMTGRLAWAEAESLPFADATFDASWSVGGFNYYRDHEATLREMRRVTKPGGPVVVADEVPSLHRAGLGHLLGVPSLDGWWLRRLGLDREFVQHGAGVRRRSQVSGRTRLAPGRPPPDLAWVGLLSGGYITLVDKSILISWRHRMSTASQEFVASSPWKADCDTWRCLKCQGSLHHDPSGPALVCSGCAARLPIENDILIVKDQTTENNQVAQAFYDSPLWPKFRFWEWFTWVCNGGERRARNQVLKHLPTTPGLNLLDVAIGDGVYLDWLPADWRIVGVDISRSQLEACRKRAAGRNVRLAQSEAEQLPLESHQFDAVLSIGAFNYFNDPEGALREMVRVARPGRADRDLRRGAQLD